MSRQGYNYQYSVNNFITPEELKSIIVQGVPEVSKHQERDRLLISTGWETGARISEVLTLVPEHIFAQEIVLVNLKQRLEKGEEPPEKITEVSTDLCTWLKEYCEKNNIQKGQFVFFSNWDRDKHLDRSLVHKMITAASEKARVYRLGKKNIRSGRRYKGISYHVLRHSLATYLLRHGVKLEMVGKQLGHANQASTQRYASVILQDVRATIDKVGVNLYHP